MSGQAHPRPSPFSARVGPFPVPYASLAQRAETYHRGATAIAPNTTNARSNPNWTAAGKSC